jgi:hypothetical protein
VSGKQYSTTRPGIQPQVDGNQTTQFQITIDFLKELRSEPLLIAIDPSKDHHNITGCTTHNIEETIAFLSAHEGAYNLYYSLNPTKTAMSKKPSKADIAAVEFLHADCDPTKDETPDAAKARYLGQFDNGFEPPPTVIVDSGNGIQALWRLKEPIVLDGADRERLIAEAEARNKDLMERLGTDPSTRNIDRILRLPGTTNQPTKAKLKKGRVPCPASLIKFNGVSYGLEAFPLPAPEEVTKPGSPDDGGHHARQNDNEDKLERMIRDGPTEGEFKSNRSGAVWWVINEMLRQNSPSSAILSTLLDRNNKISEHLYAQSKPRAYAKRQIEEARAKLGSTVQTPPLQIQSSTEFVTNFTPPDYLIDGLLQRRFIYSMTGPTGEGKTSVALLIALCVERGWPIDGREIDKGKVLFLAGENPDDVRMRWIKQLADAGIDPSEVNVFFVPGSFAISDRIMRDRIMHANGAHGPFDLIIVDTSAAFFEGDDENVNTQMLAHAKRLRGLIGLITGNPTVIVTSHPVKNFSRENMLPRGGGAFLNEMDGNLTCMKINGTMITELNWQGKFRGIDFNAIPFRLGVGKSEKLRDSKGRHIWTVVARQVSERERDVAEDAAIKNKAKLLAVIDRLPGTSLSDLAQECGWFTKDGKPYKVLVSRYIHALNAEKKIKKQSGRWVLTKEGKKDADENDDENDLPF